MTHLVTMEFTGAKAEMFKVFKEDMKVLEKEMLAAGTSREDFNTEYRKRFLNFNRQDFNRQDFTRLTDYKLFGSLMENGKIEVDKRHYKEPTDLLFDKWRYKCPKCGSALEGDHMNASWDLLDIQMAQEFVCSSSTCQRRFQVVYDFRYMYEQ